jgi:anthranilate synthase/aminodeoxychorismate synthase-like glutamine amidotransferase
MILFIDNYDSFTYNLVDYFGQLEPDLKVVRNDRLTVSQIASMKPAAIVISPGPGTPQDAGISCKLIESLHREIPILGVCLGHQCIAKVFGGNVIKASAPVHGKTADIIHDNSDIYRGLPNPFRATRYHSLMVERESLPDVFEITAETADGTIMGIKHRDFPLNGVQFHPESILTRDGFSLIKNWINSYSTSKKYPQKSKQRKLTAI